MANAVVVDYKRDKFGGIVGNIYVQKGHEEEYRHKKPLDSWFSDGRYGRFGCEVVEATRETLFFYNGHIYDPKAEMGVTIEAKEASLLETLLQYGKENRMKFAGYYSVGMAPVGLLYVSYYPPFSEKETERLRKDKRGGKVKAPVHIVSKKPIVQQVKEFPPEKIQAVDESISYHGQRLHKFEYCTERGELTKEAFFITKDISIRISRNYIKLNDKEENRCTIFAEHATDFLLDAIKQWREEFIDNDYAHLWYT